MNKEIGRWRRKIDKIDDAILKLLAERKRAVLEIGKIKKRNKFKIVDRQREEEIFGRLRKKVKKFNLNEDYIINLFKEIIKNSRKEEKNG